MSTMSEFFIQMLNALASFLVAEPIIYLFGLVLLLFVIKCIKTICT